MTPRLYGFRLKAKRCLLSGVNVGCTVGTAPSHIHPSSRVRDYGGPEFVGLAPQTTTCSATESLDLQSQRHLRLVLVGRADVAQLVQCLSEQLKQQFQAFHVLD